MNDNMKIWSHASKTDPSATKENNQSGYKSTTINGYWMIQKATELWGPIGSDWGYEIIEERFDEGAPIIDKTTQVPLCKTVVHTLKIALFYPGSTKDVIQYGHTPFIYQSKYGPITDTEAPKKSLTDAIKKALSMLGFSSDVYTGEFEDQNYVQQRLDEEALDKAENKEEEKLRQASEYKQWFDDTQNTMSNSVSVYELEAIFKIAYMKMKRRGDSSGIKAFTIEKDRVKKLLEDKEK